MPLADSGGTNRADSAVDGRDLSRGRVARLRVRLRHRSPAAKRGRICGTAQRDFGMSLGETDRNPHLCTRVSPQSGQQGVARVRQIGDAGAYRHVTLVQSRLNLRSERSHVTLIPYPSRPVLGQSPPHFSAARHHSEPQQGKRRSTGKNDRQHPKQGHWHHGHGERGGIHQPQAGPGRHFYVDSQRFGVSNRLGGISKQRLHTRRSWRQLGIIPCEC